MELLYKQEVYEVIGAAIEVHRQLGSSFLEAVYQEAMEVELAERGVPLVAQKPLAIRYKGRLLDKSYIADFLCFDGIIVEIQAQSRLTNRERVQLINFGDPGRLDGERLIN